MIVFTKNEWLYGLLFDGGTRKTVWLLTTPDCTGPYQARNDWLFHFDDELKVVRRANYPQLTKGMNSSRRTWWGVLQSLHGHIWCFLRYSVEAQAPGVQDICLHTRAKYFSTSKTWTKMTTAVRCGLVLPGAVNSHTPKNICCYKSAGDSRLLWYWKLIGHTEDSLIPSCDMSVYPTVKITFLVYNSNCIIGLYTMCKVTKLQALVLGYCCS